jgi:beta-glucosidase
VSAEIRNTGKRFGAEVVQLYVRDVAASMTRPVKELKGFRKVALEPGAATRVTFTLTAADLMFCDAQLDWIAEPGAFTVWIGPSSAEGLEGSFTLK